MGPRTQRERRRNPGGECCCCRKTFSFCWKCPCGLSICQACMDENSWGMTCNGITWICPDCGKSNNF
ncbi:MAG: hypothetical protein ABII00_07220 [Elusimicrobiota bacterium]